jgi:hypothetical protein
MPETNSPKKPRMRFQSRRNMGSSPEAGLQLWKPGFWPGRTFTDPKKPGF